MDIREVYIWLEVIKERAEKDLQEDKVIECIEFCKKMIREKVTGYADESI